MSPIILFFNEIPADGLPLVGGKGLNLGRLTRARLGVPPGFVVTTHAYRHQHEHAVLVSIGDAYRKLGGGPVAVRSSATAEDLPDASFAGQQETFLGVDGELAVMAAVRRCWDSLFTERAVAYRQAQGIPDEAVAMAVVVQRLIPAEVAGVLFTRDPLRLDSSRVLVEAAWGLGEAVVSGRVNPDRWALDLETGEVLEAEIARKAVAVTGEGEVPIPSDWQGRPCLKKAELHALLELGYRIEAEYGSPQDVEWAMLDGRLYVLQSRPITAAVNEREALRSAEIARLRERAEAGGTVWARYSLAEVLPEPLPLTWELWRRFMSGQGGYGTLYRELGYDPDPTLAEDGVLDLVAGRPYFNLSRDARLYFAGFPQEYPFEKLKQNPELAIYPRLETNLSHAPKGFMWKMVGYTRKMLAAEKTLERAAAEVPGTLEFHWFPRIRQFSSEVRALDLASLSEADLLRHFRAAAQRVFDEFAPQTLKPSVLAGLAIQKLEAELKPALGSEARAAVDRLLAGAASGAEWDLGAGLRAAASGRISRAEFGERFGHRGLGEMELANPRWREDPAGIPSPGSVERAPAPASAAEQSLEGLVAGKKCNVRQARLLLDRARQFTALREAGKHHLMLAYDALRQLLVELDHRHGLQGGLFYLLPEELDALVAGTDFRAVIAARRKRRALLLGLEAPRVLFSDDPEALGRPLAPATGKDVFQGTGVSAGVASGPALVLRSPDQAPPEARDFILVCPSTDPGWVPLFLRARGVVLETGGVLSHGAIVAREFGLPAVVNIAGACSLFRTGQSLQVDGNAGRITAL